MWVNSQEKNYIGMYDLILEKVDADDRILTYRMENFTLYDFSLL